jgi:hypothetical protein
MGVCKFRIMLRSVAEALVRRGLEVATALH